MSDYTNGWPDLPGVKNDIAKVKRALEENGFHVVTVENPDDGQLEDAFGDFIDSYGVDDNNRLLFYFAGHGYTMKAPDGRDLGYIVPSNAPLPQKDKNSFHRKALNMRSMDKYARDILSKHALFLFDACFSGQLFNLSRAVPTSISYKTTKPVRQFITSGSAEEEVPDKSLFREYFVAAITTNDADGNGDGYLTASELSEYLFDNVTNYSYNNQHPQYGKIRDKHLDKGDFVFMLKPSIQPMPTTPGKGLLLILITMIKYITGNILESNAQALINTVNTVGVMGKGIALQFKKAYLSNFKAYAEACKRNEMDVGKLFVTRDSNLHSGEKIIINFPTKKDWRKPSEYSYIESGLDDLVKIIEEEQINSVAIPPLGAGNGGLEWEKVKKIIEQKLSLLNIEIFIYEPTAQIKEQIKKERVKLTDARALLLYVLYDLVKNGEYVSEFSSEKICYFLQRFGAEKYFKLKYEPNFYGPYSGKVRFVLNILNGSYIMGFSDMNKKPFESLTIVANGCDTVKKHIQDKQELLEIANKTMTFLNGFYSDFALELLSSVDYITAKNQAFEKNVISRELEEWSNRKHSMFSNSKYIDISIRHLQNTNFS